MFSPMTAAATATVVTLLFLAALAASQQSASTLGEQISHSFYFESHGRDDLREWRAAILKGAQYIKIDFNFIQDPETCRQQKRLPPSYNFSMGCFLLVHSFQNHTFWGAPALEFNTTLDIASWLLDDSNMDVMMIRPLVFQCCFKGKPNLCDGSAGAAQWTALMDAFYALVQPIISDPARINGNVQFVFDQLNQADQCILLRWRPWNSTWIGESGTGEDNNRGGNVTFQMVNMATTQTADWQHLNNTNFGKFHDGDYAIVAWEPVDEVDCNGFFSYFRTFRYANPAGTILAYNADPSMFHVFTANETTRYSHFAFGPSAALTPVMWFAELRQQLFTVSLLSNDTAPLVISVHARGPRGTFLFLASVEVTLPGGAASTICGGCLQGLGGFAINSTAVQLLLSTCSGRVVPVVVAFSADHFVVDTSQPSYVVGEGCTSIGFALQGFSNSSELLAACANYDGVGAVDVSLFTVSATKAKEVSAVTRAAANVSSISDGFNVAVTYAPSGGWIGIVVSWASDRQVFAATLEGTTVGSLVNLTAVLPADLTTHVKVGVGKVPFTTFAPPRVGDERNTAMLMSYGWSFCYNDLLIDDDAFTMTAVKICDLQDAWYTNLFEVVSNPINSYVFTNFSLFAGELETYSAAPQHLNGFATSCSDTVFHGIFDIGYNASVLLLPRQDSDVDINVGGYLGVGAMTSLTWPWVSVSFCGNPLPHDGQVILDSFPLFGFYNRSAL